jgi:hypothetical protein
MGAEGKKEGIFTDTQVSRCTCGGEERASRGKMF